MVKLHLYVEGGGGDSKLLRTACRRGFSEFLAKAGLKGHMPHVVSCGGRRQAYDDFCIALRQRRHAAMLLVDSEDPVTVPSPWLHLLQRPADAWPTPAGANDADCHLMVQCMESWLVADRETLEAFFGQGFNAKALPPEQTPIETVAKLAVYQALASTTRNCKTKAQHGKGEHSFLVLGKIDPAKVTAASPWAAQFVNILKQTMGA
jgi:hypothetical protein